MGCFKKEKIKTKVNELAKNGWLAKNVVDKVIENFPEKLEFTSPNKEDIFNAFSLFEPSATRILILGQDPYPDNDDYRVKHYGPRAHGFAFSFKNGKEPADDSLLNIFKAISQYRNDKKIEDIYNWNTNLEEWAKNNKVLLLNTALTYKDKEKHFIYWESFIQEIIKNLLLCNTKIAIFLWGKEAQNVFLQVLNKYSELNNISKQIKEIKCFTFTLNKRNNNFNKQKQVKKYKESLHIKIASQEIEIYMANHPSQLSENNNGEFIEYSSKSHFKACDKFLGEPIFLNFPENNQEKSQA